MFGLSLFEDEESEVPEAKQPEPEAKETEADDSCMVCGGEGCQWCD